ncbi:terpenoid cyclases/Protein prenyltransferase [Basidiobolus meristosporus CBS 931.73]|uniref:Protein farnesyltransferase subunit beta n=1 Tax=Basidiobolus meristosporus CBS 931.73 TaxID=1314790 RepID=A0A1Y1YQG9_9FUNG|nr:terpenoid cyclases/Protein prenyltransferase [Basidiobolus meristosporus CBS 931.73]|eukprot:ORY00270.1 terpenoid cyclases/Protein prenyltransferase [Basidiobolus meristosporus CBS 931.73]
MGIIDCPKTLAELSFDDDDLPTETSLKQNEVEESISSFFRKYKTKSLSKENIILRREPHIKFTLRGLDSLNQFFVVLDSSKPWLCYWMLHSLNLLEYELPEEIKLRLVRISTLEKCQNSTGGFGGGPSQMSHLAPTYAAINALAIIGTPAAYEIINRETLYQWLLSLKQPDGSFIMHVGGEVDVRGSYCALSVASLLNILTPELMDGAAEFIARCQTYEGGIGSYPGSEAHGGYAYCGLAAMEILGKAELLNLPRLVEWAASRQMCLEGGFQGRTNKLVDGCYSLWMGGLFPLLESILERGKSRADPTRYLQQHALYDKEALQEYILLCCQKPSGGLRDKPGMNPDYYHTCYCLSGLSHTQNKVIRKENTTSVDLSGLPGLNSLLWQSVGSHTSVVGDASNLVLPTHPVHNIGLASVHKIMQHFYGESALQVMNS